VRELSEMAEIDKGTIVRIEAGGNAYSMTLRRLREVLEQAGVRFIDPQEGVPGPGVALKWGVEALKRPQPSANAEPAGDPTLEALSWDWEEQEPVPPEIEELREYWRARPAEWARMHASSRWALLQEMRIRGV
jgi:hypothetical protein